MAQMKVHNILWRIGPLFENRVTFVIDFQKVVCEYVARLSCRCLVDVPCQRRAHLVSSAMARAVAYRPWALAELTWCRPFIGTGCLLVICRKLPSDRVTVDFTQSARRTRNAKKTLDGFQGCHENVLNESPPVTFTLTYHIIAKLLVKVLQWHPCITGTLELVSFLPLLMGVELRVCAEFFWFWFFDFWFFPLCLTPTIHLLLPDSTVNLNLFLKKKCEDLILCFAVTRQNVRSALDNGSTTKFLMVENLLDANAKEKITYISVSNLSKNLARINFLENWLFIYRNCC